MLSKDTVPTKNPITEVGSKRGALTQVGIGSPGEKNILAWLRRIGMWLRL